MVHDKMISLVTTSEHKRGIPDKQIIKKKSNKTNN